MNSSKYSINKFVHYTGSTALHVTLQGGGVEGTICDPDP